MSLTQESVGGWGWGWGPVDVFSTGWRLGVCSVLRTPAAVIIVNLFYVSHNIFHSCNAHAVTMSFRTLWSILLYCILSGLKNSARITIIDYTLPPLLSFTVVHSRVWGHGGMVIKRIYGWESQWANWLKQVHLEGLSLKKISFAG